MKRILLLSLISMLAAATAAQAATIKNKLRQNVVISLAGGKKIKLLPDGTASVTEKELSSPELQSMLARGQISLINDKQSGKNEKPAAKKK